VQDFDPGPQEHKDRRAPAKKNRVHLDTTEEEEDFIAESRNSSDSPPLSISPPHEVKVRQISQGVEDLTWPNALKTAPGEDGAPGDSIESGPDANLAPASEAPPTVADTIIDDVSVPSEGAPSSQTSAMVSHGDKESPTTGASGQNSQPTPVHDGDSETVEKEKGGNSALASQVDIFARVAKVWNN
jgi:Ran-binding protein 3